MSYATQIRKVATQIASDAEARASTLKREISDLEAQIVEVETKIVAVETKLDAANLAYERLTRFQPEIGGRLQCPRCWIDHETRSEMIAFRAETPSKYDAFRCHKCGFDLSFTLKG
jgi:hypothetical protein